MLLIVIVDGDFPTRMLIRGGSRANNWTFIIFLQFVINFFCPSVFKTHESIKNFDRDNGSNKCMFYTYRCYSFILYSLKKSILVFFSNFFLSNLYLSTSTLFIHSMIFMVLFALFSLLDSILQLFSHFLNTTSINLLKIISTKIMAVINLKFSPFLSFKLLFFTQNRYRGPNF